MPAQSFPYCSIYNDIDKVQRYWNSFKPAEGKVLQDNENWRTLIPFLEQASYQNCVLVLIWNVLTNRFIYHADIRKVAGYDASQYLAEDGIDFSLSNIHPDYLTAGLLLQQKAFEYVAAHKPEAPKIVINLDFLYRKSNGAYIHFLQQIVIIGTDDNGFPLLMLSYLHDITYLKKDKTANIIITTPNEMQWWNFNFDTNIVEPVSPLSKQEKNILAHLANGKSSKAIAQELFISSLTIDTHRRHILKKTNCTDTTGMITYAKIVGLL